MKSNPKRIYISKGVVKQKMTLEEIFYGFFHCHDSQSVLNFILILQQLGHKISWKPVNGVKDSSSTLRSQTSSPEKALVEKKWKK
jgi:hypothetical protein